MHVNPQRFQQVKRVLEMFQVAPVHDHVTFALGKAPHDLLADAAT
jgi:hypothetical protein